MSSSLLKNLGLTVLLVFRVGVVVEVVGVVGSPSQ